MRFLPFLLLLLLSLLFCDRDALAPTLSYQVDEPATISHRAAPTDGLHPSIAFSNGWQERSPAFRKFGGLELSNPKDPVTLRQLETRLYCQ